MKVYLDNAATTQLDPQVLRAMMPYLKGSFGNPMSVHQFGADALAGVDSAREQVADFLHCAPREVIFTSGATESNNLALKGIIDAYKGDILPHIIISAIEHHCVLETAQYLEKKKLAEVSYIKPDRCGIIAVKDVLASIKKNTILISLMYVNNEIGSIQPIAEIGKKLKKLKQKIYFHTDAVQAANYLNCDVQKLGVDLLSFSGHKIFGPKGVGVLYVWQGVKINKIQHGGEQEFKLRAGTHNVPGIVGLGKAVELIKKRSKKESQKIKALRDYLWLNINKKIPKVMLNGDNKNTSPHILNVSFKNIEGEGILISLDMEGVAVSTGSACSSGSLEASHVMLAISRGDHLRAHSSVRFSLSHHTKKTDINYLLKILPSIVSDLRKISPFKD
jgi:cysteine desulfurase